MAYESNNGISQIAAVVSERIQEMLEKKPMALDIGVIQADGSLQLNNYARPLPQGLYSCLSPRPKPEARVLAAWVQNEAIVLGVIKK